MLSHFIDEFRSDQKPFEALYNSIVFCFTLKKKLKNNSAILKIQHIVNKITFFLATTKKNRGLIMVIAF